jgi:aryl-alcohol dehydrogenase-like predicted oxidoreductase
VKADICQDTLEAYRALEVYADHGQIRNLGVSNIYDRSELEWLISEARIPVQMIQNRWYEGNGWDWNGRFTLIGVAVKADLTVYDLCQENGIRYQ